MKNTISTYQAQTPKNNPPPPLYAIPHSSSQLPIPTPHFQFSILHFQFFLLLSIASLSAQSYTPMAVDGARWIYVQQDVTGPPNGCLCIKGFHGYFIEGDTLLNGHTYYKLYHQKMASVNGDRKPPYQGISQPLFQGYLRDDTAKRQVFLLPPYQWRCMLDSTWTERMLYDFDKNTGDSIYIYDPCRPSLQEELVDSIFFQSTLGLYGPIYRYFPHMEKRGINQVKIIAYSYMIFNVRHIEGLGSIYGLYRQRGEMQPEFLLIGYCRNDQSCSGLVTDLNSLKQKRHIEIFPNPARHYLEVTHSLPPLAHIEVLDLYGRVVYQHHPWPGTETTRLDISALTQGLYLLRVLDAQGQVLAYRKWVKAAMP